jgi:SAM-dependent methyltransferase
MAAVEIDLYSVFLDHVFIRGRISSADRPVADAFLHLGGGHWGKLQVLAESDGSFAKAFPFEERFRPELFPAKLRLRFTDGSEQTVDDATAGVLGEQSFWKCLHPVLNDLRRRGHGRMLEVGSRARSGISRRDLLTPEGWEYVGFDIMGGENVDVVGDAHELSTIFPPDHFDAIGSFAVLEHMLMPWKLAIEMNTVLKTGGVGFFVTHQTCAVHDEPWDFWRYSDRAWDAILNAATGFEIIEAKMTEPVFIVPKVGHAAVDSGDHYVGYMGSIVVFRKIGPTSLRWDVKVGDIIPTRYPPGDLPLLNG